MRSKDARLQKCDEENELMRKRIIELEGRFDDVESQTRTKNVILSGKALNGLANDNLSNSVIQLLRNKVQYELVPDNILTAYRIGVRPPMQTADSRGLMLKLRDVSSKRDTQSSQRVFTTMTT